MWELQTGTALHETDGNFSFCVFNDLVPGSAWHDIAAFKRVGGNGKAEVHVLSGAHGYQQFLIHTELPIPAATPDHEFIWHSFNNTIWVINKNNGGSTTLMRMSFTNVYNHTILPLGDTSRNHQFMRSPSGDLIVVNKAGASGQTELYILSAASGYQQFSARYVTALHATDDSFEFGWARGDLVAFKKRGTGTQRTEAHVLSASTNYQQFIVQTGTELHETDGTFQILFDQPWRMAAIKKSGTGTNSTEVHIQRIP